MADLLAVEDEIAREIAGRLRLRLTATQRRRLDRRPTGNAEAYQFYIRGRFYWNQFTEDSTRKAIECFRQALAKDPEYALAYAGLADCYSVLGVHFWRPSEAFPEAKKALKRALELDDTLADVHVSLGFVLVCYDWQWPAAEREFQEALRLNPNLALAHSGYGFFLCTVGRVPESIAAYERAQKLDPLFPSAAADIAWCHFLVGRLDRALAACQHALEVDPNYRWAVLNLALFHVLSGSCEKAVVFAEKARGAGPEDPNALAVLGYVYARGGRTDVARATLAALEALAQRGYVAPFVRALVHAGLGEADEAFHWLRRAYEDRNHQLIGLARDPMLASLRTDPRFAALVRDVGSPCGAEAAEHQP